MQKRDYENDLGIPLLPGEHLVYKAGRNGGLSRLVGSTVMATNKRFLLVSRRPLSKSYRSIFYNKISSIRVSTGPLGSRFMVYFGEGKESQSSTIMLKDNAQAFSVFSIISNQISSKEDISNAYKGGAYHMPEGNVGEAGKGAVAEAVTAIEESNKIFAEMIEKVEHNQKQGMQQLVALSKRLQVPEFMRKERLADTASKAQMQTIEIAQRINRTFRAIDLLVPTIPETPRASVREEAAAEPTAKRAHARKKTEGKQDMSPDKDMLIFRHRRAKEQILGSAAKK